MSWYLTVVVLLGNGESFEKHYPMDDYATCQRSIETAKVPDNNPTTTMFCAQWTR